MSVLWGLRFKRLLEAGRFFSVVLNDIPRLTNAKYDVLVLLRISDNWPRDAGRLFFNVASNGVSWLTYAKYGVIIGVAALILGLFS
jgi:hypothetical protein